MYKNAKTSNSRPQDNVRAAKQNKLQQRYASLAQATGYRFNDLNIIREAMTRQSAIEEKLPQAGRQNYQRMEFIGDRVLNFFVLRLLIERDMCCDSGALNDLKIRSISNSGHMLKIGQQLQLHKYIIRGAGERTVTEKMYADGVEALLGAIYIDSSYNDERTFMVVKRLFQPYLMPTLDRKQLVANAQRHQESKSETSSDTSDYDDDDSELYDSDDSLGHIDMDQLDALLKELKKRDHDEEHFDGGAFKFKHTVLNWSWQEVMRTLPTAREMSPLPEKFENPNARGYVHGYYDDDDFDSDDEIWSARETYFNSFKKLVLEEARAILATGCEAYENNKAACIQLTLHKSKESKNLDNPSIFTMRGKLPKDFDSGSSNIGLILEPLETEDTIQLLGLASYKEKEEFEDVEFEIKVVVPSEHLDIFDDDLCEKDARWQASVLGCLVTQQRMYEVCTKKPRIPFGKDIYTGTLEPLPKASKKTEQQYSEILEHLNEPQRLAVLRFLKIESGLQMVQGPPGTGKTTTLVALLQILYKQNKRVLVCADSNKGVQVILKRFYALEPDAAVILSGVKKKLAPELEEIFLHTWGENVCAMLNENIFMLQQLIIASNQKEQTIERLALLHNAIPAIITVLDKLAMKIKRIVPSYSDTEKWERALYFLRQSLKTKSPGKIVTLINASIIFLQSPLYKIVLASQVNKGQTCSDLEKAILEHVNLVFSTLSTSGRRSIQEMPVVDVLVIDEASQAVEPATVIPMGMEKLEYKEDFRCLMLGDTRQLPPTVISQEAVKKKFARSMMYRLLEDRQQPYSLLSLQYRMHEKIMNLVSGMYYNNKLKMGDGYVAEELNFPKVLAPCSFINVDTTEKEIGHSYTNLQEAHYVVQILQYLSVHGIDIKNQVGVITFYAGQVKEINKLIDQQTECQGVTVSTVDGFQGDERKIIIVSFVRANSRRKVGFVAAPERLNVALSRAQSSLIMLGCCSVLESRKNDVADLIQNMRRNNLLFGETELQQTLKAKQKASAAQGNPPKNAPADQLHNNCRPLEQALSYRFEHPDIIRTALTRTSAIEERLAEAANESGWRARFLGEHFLKLMLAMLLLNKYSGAHEEELHKHEARLVTNAFLAQIASAIKLDKAVIKGLGETEMTEQMFADSIRSVVGAVYLDVPEKAIARDIISRFCMQNFWPQPARRITTTTATQQVHKSQQPSKTQQNSKNKSTIGVNKKKVSGQNNTTAKPTAIRKNVLCKFFKQGNCPKGNLCSFAHGERELGTLVTKHGVKR